MQLNPTTTKPEENAVRGNPSGNPGIPAIVVENGWEKIWIQVKLALGQDIRREHFQPDPCEERPGMGNHPANQSTHLDWDRRVTMATIEESTVRGRMLLLRQLEKLEQGSYGKCDRCDQEIPVGRLESQLNAVACCICHPKVVSELERNRFDLYKRASQATAA